MPSSSTTTCVSIRSGAPALLTDLFQQSKDVEDKLRDLIPWLTKLKDSVTTAGVDGDEAIRREELTRCVSHFRCLVN